MDFSPEFLKALRQLDQFNLKNAEAIAESNKELIESLKSQYSQVKNVQEPTTERDGHTVIRAYGVISDVRNADLLQYVYGVDAAFSASDIKNRLKDVGDVIFQVNSVGGLALEAAAMEKAITEHRNAGNNVKCEIEGVCFSAATYIATACEKENVSIAPKAMFGIHNTNNNLVLFKENAEAKEFREVANMLISMADMMDGMNKALVKGYSDYSGNSSDKVQGWMDNTTTWTGEDAVEAGWAGEVYALSKESDGEGVSNSLSDAFDKLGVYSYANRMGEHFNF